MSTKKVCFYDTSNHLEENENCDYENECCDNALAFENINIIMEEQEQDLEQEQEVDLDLDLEEEQPVSISNTITNTKLKRDPNAISYDDILNSLGFGVNNAGLYKKNNTQPQEYSQPNFQEQQQSQQNKSIDPRIKNSAIYNKYFKNYKDPNEIVVPKKPLTPQERRNLMIKQYIERQEALKRISRIKSKKMLYSTTNIAISSAPQQQAPNLNKLFMFSNRR